MASDLEIAFPRLAESEIAILRRQGTERPAADGQKLFEAGMRGFSFFVVLAGEVEILDHSRQEARTVVVHGPGQFTGDVDMLTGRAAIVTARMRGDGRVLELDREALRRVIGGQPELSERLLKAFLMRRTLLLQDGYEGVKIVGSRFSPQAHRLRDFATRNAIPFTWLDVEQDERAEALLCEFGIPAAETPVVVGRRGELLRNPTVEMLASCAGLSAELDPDELYDLVIVGAGPAGLAASVYAASEGLRTLTLDAEAAGGQAGTSSRIENYLGFPAGLSGGDLARRAVAQARKFGAEILTPQEVRGVRIDGPYRVLTLGDGSELATRVLLVATGIAYRTLDLPGVEALTGAGVYYGAAMTEAFSCRDEDVYVIGGGNSAGQAAMHLSQYARRVTILVRGVGLAETMSQYLIDQIAATGNIVVEPRTQVVAVAGEGHLESVTIACAGDRRTVPACSLFVFIGAAPRTEWLGDLVARDQHGFILTGADLARDGSRPKGWPLERDPYLLETSVPGIFAAGDVRHQSVKRVASAVGEGSIAVQFTHRYLAEA